MKKLLNFFISFVLKNIIKGIFFVGIIKFKFKSLKENINVENIIYSYCSKEILQKENFMIYFNFKSRSDKTIFFLISLDNIFRKFK